MPLMGRLAIHLEMITMEQLTEVLRVRGRPGEERNVGDILLALGFITQNQLVALVAAQRKVIAKHDDAKKQAAAANDKTQATAPNAEKQAVAPPPAQKPEPAGEPSSLFASEDATLDSALRDAVARGASDLHLRSGQSARLRVAGTLVAVDGPVPPAEAVEAMLLGALDPEARTEFERDGEADSCYTVEGLGRFRVNIYREQRGIDGVFRHIPAKPPSLEELGLPQSVAKLTTYHQGLVLITGPTSSGKTSTLACLVDLINEERRDHILSIEDPIEYLHASKRCLVNQRSVKRHTESFGRALRAGLREDPDVILSESLRAVVSQRLLARADGKGRVAALETLIITKAVANLIRENKVFQISSILQTGARQGMQSFERSIDQLLEAGTITQEEATRHRKPAVKRAA